MLSRDDLAVMDEQEKLDLITQLNECQKWGSFTQDVLMKLMDDDSPSVREKAIVSLWDLASEELIDPLMDKALNDPSDEVRAKAASVLGIFIYEGAIMEDLDQAQYLAVRKFLLDLVRNEEEPILVRRLSIEALSFSQDPDVLEWIDWAYEQPELETRLSAIFAMGRCGHRRYHDTILAEMASSEPKLVVEAINAAGEIGMESATPRLRNLARAPDRDVRIAAIWALAGTRGPGALETLEMCALSRDEEVARVAEDAIEEYLSMPPMPDFDEDFDDDDAQF